MDPSTCGVVHLLGLVHIGMSCVFVLYQQLSCRFSSRLLRPRQASINAFQLQTLALQILWAVFPCLALFYERPRVRRLFVGVISIAAPGGKSLCLRPQMLRAVLLFYFLFGTLAAGLEKVHSNWCVSASRSRNSCSVFIVDVFLVGRARTRCTGF